MSMHNHQELDKKILLQKIRTGSILYAGNVHLKIFGRLDCRSGKRMRKENRVFFETQEEAITLGFRPCGHCMTAEYRKFLTQK
jgi:methylphosphotriester-DNA--protein-cysteine methyltransferase